MKTYALGIALVLVAAGCSGTYVGTETGNPPIVSPARLSVEPGGADSVVVVGESGAVRPGGGEVSVRNRTRDGEEVLAPVGSDGSFMAALPGSAADEYEVVASNDAGSSEPTTVGEGWTGPTAGSGDQDGGPATGVDGGVGSTDWQVLHECQPGDPMDELRLEQAPSIDADQLELRVSHAGGCAEHLYGLCYEPQWTEGEPIGVRVHVLHESHGDSCEALLYEDLSFDLAPFQEVYRQAYRVDWGSATLGFDNCVRGNGEVSGCSVVYSWGQADSA